jgi:hydroxypyruvate reductase
MTPQTRAALLTEIWWAAVHAVAGNAAVANSLDTTPIPRPDLIVAVGKAAVSMAKAAHAWFPFTPLLAITKSGHTEPGTSIEVVQSAHPIPDLTSLNAGSRLLAEVVAAPKASHLLLLVSGGASSLVEVPRPGLSLDDLAGLNRALLASGKDIGTMNAERSQHSLIKGGGLLGQFRGSHVTVLAMSDTRGDLIQTIGSGIGLCPPRPGLTCDTRIVASNTVARAAAAAKARELGLTVLGASETLYDDVAATARRMADDLRPGPGLTIWGGEPTVVLPPDPGSGGRNQALALQLAQLIQGQDDLSVLVAGTDGNDGPTDAAGGLVTGQTWTDSGATFLTAADSGTYLARHRALFITGPTGTNVMDLALALRG